MKKTLPCTRASKRIKYLIINLTKEMKTINHCRKKLKHKYKATAHLWTGRFNIVMMSLAIQSDL